MFDILIFGGTTEGREIAEAARRLKTGRSCVFTATEYGGSLIEPSERLVVHSERLSEEKIGKMLCEHQDCTVIDATHPFAEKISESLKSLCESTNHEYQRVLRKETVSEENNELTIVPSVKAAVEYLKQTDGNVLVTTGSKELHRFCELPDFEHRIYARVLSIPSVVAHCAELGFQGKHLISMQGPFSKELNIAMLKQLNAEYLITKESGITGGFPEKLEAARLSGAKLIVIGRPAQDPNGISVEECIRRMEIKYGIDEHFDPPTDEQELLSAKDGIQEDTNIHIALVGIGTSSKAISSMTEEAVEACQAAELIFGAKRMITVADQFPGEKIAAYQPDEIIKELKNRPDKKNIVILYSGDTGFFSGAKQMEEAVAKSFSEASCRRYPGISSIAAMASALHTNWEDADIVSIHGRKDNVLQHIRTHEKTFILLGGRTDAAKIAKDCIAFGMLDVQMSLGECLGQTNERISIGGPFTFFQVEHDALSVLFVQNPFADRCLHPYLPDHIFSRGKVPMTKEEIRTIVTAKLHLQKDAIVYDIGAGTGSVTAEIARCVPDGKVYAIEQKEAGITLIEDNAQMLGLNHIQTIHGRAPEALVGIKEKPDAAFIGGSGGELAEVISLLKKKNPEIRIVMTAVTLETTAIITELLKQYEAFKQEIVQVQVSRSETLGNYHLWKAENPVLIAVLDFGVGI